MVILLGTDVLKQITRLPKLLGTDVLYDVAKTQADLAIKTHWLTSPYVVWAPSF